MLLKKFPLNMFFDKLVLNIPMRLSQQTLSVKFISKAIPWIFLKVINPLLSRSNPRSYPSSSSNYGGLPG